jgi:hypothetical protein
MTPRLAKMVVFSLLVIVVGVAGSQSQTTSPDSGKLLGTWRVVSAVYDDEPVKDIGKTEIWIKHITDVQFIWVRYSTDTKQVKLSQGGTYSVKGDSYIETPQYNLEHAGLDSMREKEQKFTWRVDGDRFYQNGRLSNGVKLEEVYERVRR